MLSRGLLAHVKRKRCGRLGWPVFQKLRSLVYRGMVPGNEDMRCSHVAYVSIGPEQCKFHRLFHRSRGECRNWPGNWLSLIRNLKRRLGFRASKPSLPFSRLAVRYGNVSNAMNPAQAAAPEVKYICGDCGTENGLKQGDVVRCRECGYRILYKKRTQRIVQFEAR